MINSIISKYDDGPFGHHDASNLNDNRIRNLLVLHEGLSVIEVEAFTISENFILHKGIAIAQYKWFGDGMAYFTWLWTTTNSTWKQQSMQRYGIDFIGSLPVLKPKFRITLNVFGNPVLSFNEHFATPHLHMFLRLVLLNHAVKLKSFEIRKAAGAHFSVGADDSDCGYFVIAFRIPQLAPAFVEHLNENYDPGIPIDKLFKRYFDNNTLV